jgi:hypothetical protein
MLWITVGAQFKVQKSSFLGLVGQTLTMSCRQYY